MSTHNILLVDDQDLIQGIMYSMITGIFKNISVKCVSTAEMAVEEIKSNEYDLVFMDINLGESNMGGVKALEMIKEINPSQKVYMITGYPIDVNEQRVIENLAEGILEKPFKLEELSGVISKFVKK